VTNPSFALTATYGAVDIPFENIVRIEELDGQTRVHLVNGNVMQGFIATNFLFVTMNYGFDVKIPKNSIKSVIVRQ
jgi:sRNA-binding regulator protein Hfq